MKIKIGQIWIDRETKARAHVVGRMGDKWLLVFERSPKTHKMTQFILQKHYYCEKEVTKK
jgi:hypothetical protein